MSAANWGKMGGGGGLNIFFRGRNVHQVFFFLEIQALGGCRKLQKTADLAENRRFFAESHRKLQIGVHHLRSVTLRSSALQVEVFELCILS